MRRTIDSTLPVPRNASTADGVSSRVSVGYDGSPGAEDAVLWAAQESTALDVQLRIVSCHDLPLFGVPIPGFVVPTWPTDELLDRLAVQSDARLTNIRQLVGASFPDLDVDTESSMGSASEILLEGIGTGDLVVVGNSTHEGVAAFWLGSTPRHVVRHSPCPVVVVRGLDGRQRPTRVVVGTDGSPAASQAVTWAAKEAELHRISLVVVHTWEHPHLTYDTVDSRTRERTRIDASCVLDQAVQDARDQCGSDVTAQLVERSAVPGLLGSIQPGDILVLGTRGRNAISSGLFGSTVNSVLDHAPVSVVVVPDNTP